MPGTAKDYNLTDPFDGEAAILAQAHLMHDLLAQFGSVPLALAAYNAGSRARRGVRLHPSDPRDHRLRRAILGLLAAPGRASVTAIGLAVRLVA